jgi:hypothetical protein
LLPPLSVVKATDNFQLELIVLQSDTELKQNFISVKLVEFFGWFSETKYGSLKGSGKEMFKYLHPPRLQL